MLVSSLTVNGQSGALPYTTASVSVPINRHVLVGVLWVKSPANSFGTTSVTGLGREWSREAYSDLGPTIRMEAWLGTRGGDISGAMTITTDGTPTRACWIAWSASGLSSKVGTTATANGNTPLAVVNSGGTAGTGLSVVFAGSSSDGYTFQDNNPGWTIYQGQGFGGSLYAAWEQSTDTAEISLGGIEEAESVVSLAAAGFSLIYPSPDYSVTGNTKKTTLTGNTGKTTITGNTE